MASRGIYDRSWFNYFLRCVVEASLLNGTSVVQQPLPCESSRRAISFFFPCKQIIPAFVHASSHGYWSVDSCILPIMFIRTIMWNDVDRLWIPFCRSFRCLVCTRTSHFHGTTKIVHDSFTRQAGQSARCSNSLRDENLFGRIEPKLKVLIRMNFHSLLDWRCRIVSNRQKFRSKNSFIFVSVFSILTNRHAQRLNPWLDYHRFSIGHINKRRIWSAAMAKRLKVSLNTDQPH